jgi:hypothetical protein
MQTKVELERALIAKIGLTPEKARKPTSAIMDHFRKAIVSGSEVLIPAMLNDEKDRHVVAAAVRAGAEVVVTLNLKDFPRSALQPFHVEARHPDGFLIELYDLSSELVIHSPARIGQTIPPDLQERSRERSLLILCGGRNEHVPRRDVGTLEHKTSLANTIN